MIVEKVKTQIRSLYFKVIDTYIKQKKLFLNLERAFCIKYNKDINQYQNLNNLLKLGC
jgi:hypothetical protein